MILLDPLAQPPRSAILSLLSSATIVPWMTMQLATPLKTDCIVYC